MPPISPAVERAYALAASHYGLITSRQCREVGLTRNTVQRLIRQGAWTREAPGLYRLANEPRSWRGRALASAMAAGPDAVVSHRSAAHLWGLAGFWATTDIAVTVPRNRKPRPRPGVDLHESTNPGLLDVRDQFGIPVTGPGRTFLDLATIDAPGEELRRALDEIVGKGLATPAELWQSMLANTGPGRRGTGRATAALLGLVDP